MEFAGEGYCSPSSRLPTWELNRISRSSIGKSVGKTCSKMLKRHALEAIALPTQGADTVIISDYTTFASEVSWRVAEGSSNRVEARNETAACS